MTEKKLLIDAIKGAGVPFARAGIYQDKGWARFTGNQWNPDWAWEEGFLESLTLIELQELYRQIKLEHGE